MEAVAAAKKVVNNWVEKGKPSLKKEPRKASEEVKFNASRNTRTSVEALAKVSSLWKIFMQFIPNHGC